MFHAYCFTYNLQVIQTDLKYGQPTGSSKWENDTEVTSLSLLGSLVKEIL
jgi:hypothetical protein